ncbi:MAG: hypothetical protein HYY48_05640 [Gammaproteobacteria bacterium]|nr:hypothetical protein [Gammaproteobacteria bacterium]
MKSPGTALLLFALCSVGAAAQAESMILEVIPLQYQTLDNVIPVIQPLLVEGGTVTGMNNQLVVRTTPGNLDEIKQVLAEIDRKMRRLLISVNQDAARSANEREGSVSGRVREGDVTLESGERGRERPGTGVTLGDEEGDFARYRTLERETQADDRNAFRVQTVEGQAAFIQTGQSIPVPEQNVYVNPGQVTVQRTVEYHDATSGFWVLPRLHGDQVTLLVSPHMSRVLPGRAPSFEIQEVETTATGSLGEWIAIGGIDTDQSRTGRENLGATAEQISARRTVLIKVDEIP